MPLLRQGQLYLLPNALGVLWLGGIMWVFLLTFLIDNVMINIAGFLMVSFFLMGLFQANNNLKPISVRQFRIFPGPANTVLTAELTLENLAHTPIFAVTVQINTAQIDVEVIAPGECISIHFELPAQSRGIHQLPKIGFISRFPNGLFISWKSIILEGQYIVYPQPSGNKLLPQTNENKSEGVTLIQDTDGDFSGHRVYLNTDAQQHIDWKARARGLPLLVKTFSVSQLPAVKLDENQLIGLSEEARLSQLAQWVLECNHSERFYSLSVGNIYLEESGGKTHFHHSLWTLASVYSESKK